MQHCLVSDSKMIVPASYTRCTLLFAVVATLQVLHINARNTLKIISSHIMKGNMTKVVMKATISTNIVIYN